MTRENLQRIDLDCIYPDFLMRIMDVLAACEKRGAVYVATHGFRSFEEQQNLWEQGRRAPGKIVTQAQGGQSAHNFGLAIDFVRDRDKAKPGVQAGWTRGDYAALVEEAERHGLHSGRGYNDYPHVGWPKYVSGKDLEPLVKVWKKTRGDTLAKLQAVWNNL